MNKIKAHIMSDLHLDLMKANDYQDFMDNLSAVAVGDNPDIAIIAGDMTNLSPAYKNKAFTHFGDICNIYKFVIYIPGNHEYWNNSFISAGGMQAEIYNKFRNIQPLRAGSTITYMNQRFLGDTMWFPKPKPTDPPLKHWSDNLYIHDFQEFAWIRHEIFCKDVVAKATSDDIVISHHFPFTESIAQEFEGDAWNCYFHADVSKYMTTAPKMWIHGHTHHPFNYVHPVLGTKVVCNPKGYMHEGTNDDFFNNLLVTI